jgi:hypothetical protein
VQTQLRRKETGDKLHGKGKHGKLKSRDYFINIFESLIYGYVFILSSRGWGMIHQVAKATYEGEKYQVEGMQYILLALV